MGRLKPTLHQIAVDTTPTTTFDALSTSPQRNGRSVLDFFLDQVRLI